MLKLACGNTVPDCEQCPYNQGIEEGASRIDGPCGQQNCWYGCTVCRYNNLQTCDE